MALIATLAWLLLKGVSDVKTSVSASAVTVTAIGVAAASKAAFNAPTISAPVTVLVFVATV